MFPHAIAPMQGGFALNVALNVGLMLAPLRCRTTQLVLRLGWLSWRFARRALDPRPLVFHTISSSLVAAIMNMVAIIGTDTSAL